MFKLCKQVIPCICIFKNKRLSAFFLTNHFSTTMWFKRSFLLLKCTNSLILPNLTMDS